MNFYVAINNKIRVSIVLPESNNLFLGLFNSLYVVYKSYTHILLKRISHAFSSFDITIVLGLFFVASGQQSQCCPKATHS